MSTSIERSVEVSSFGFGFGFDDVEREEIERDG
jgi:hypothetical protein